jgi:hypothetical protein
MAHVWNVIDGDIYVSKNGDDVAGDGSMANPYASLNKGFEELATLGEGYKIVIGSGRWSEGVSIRPLSFIMEGDGDVYLHYTAESWFYLTLSGSDNVYNVEFINLKFSNYVAQVAIYSDNPNSASVFYYKKCNLDRKAISHFRSYGSRYYKFKDCIITNINWQYVATSAISFINCNVIDPIYKAFDPTYAENCILINLREDYTKERKNCLYINATISNDTYNIVDAYLENYGSMQETNIFPLFLDPKFNNSQIGDYTLRPDSPCLGSGKNGANIGAFGLGFSFNANNTEATEEAGAVYSQSDVGNGLENDIIRVSQLLNGVNHYLFKLQSGHSSGTIKFAKIDLGASYEIEAIRLFKNFLYNSSGQTTASADNLTTNNVADFQLKSWNLDSEEDTATTKEFRWEEIREDNSGNGNANAAYAPAQAKRITFRYAELTITLRAS